MRYRFSDIYNANLYESSSVVFIVGQHNIFNNIVVDRFRDMCSGEETISSSSGFMTEFEMDDGTLSISNSIPLESFITQVNIPSITGKWFCSVNLAGISKKQLDWINKYIKQPSQNGVLCLVGNEYKNYKAWINNKIIDKSTSVNLISLSFPNNKTLRPIVKDMFICRNTDIDDKALDLFILRMSSSYDDYGKIIDKICNENLPSGYLAMNRSDVPNISYDMVLESMKGIENFVLDDFLVYITEPLKSDNRLSRKKVYKVMNFLIEEYGAKKLVSILKNKVDELIEFRVAINNGYIPILVNYNIDEAKQLIGEDSPLYKKSDFQFKRMAEIASKTSLNDWVFIKILLSNTNIKDDTSYIKAIYSVVSRTVLNERMLDTDMGFGNTRLDGLTYLDNIHYIDEIELDNAIEIINETYNLIE